MGTRIGSITFGGLASGLASDEIIEELVQLQRRPIDVLEARKEDFQGRLDVFRDLNTKTTALRDALRSLDNMADVIRQADSDPLESALEEFRKFTATSNNASFATATVGSNAQPGTLTISVDQLAQQERERSATGYTDSTSTVTASGGTLTVGVGSPATDTDITIAADATVQDVVDAINAEAGLAVTAFIVDDGLGASTSNRIHIVGDDTGAANVLSISSDFGLSFQETQTAQDAQITLDPSSSFPTIIQGASNSFSDVVQGVSIEAKKVTSAASEYPTIAIDTDTDEVFDAISGVVSAYNAIVDVIGEQNTVDPNTNRGGPLIGDSTMVNLQQRLASTLARTFGTGTFDALGDIGIELTREGKLEIDDTDLNNAIEGNFPALASFFAGPDSLADELREVADSFVDPVGGLLTARINGTSLSISDLDDDIAAAEDRLLDAEEQLVRQFAALERIISEFQAQGNFLTQFLNTQ